MAGVHQEISYQHELFPGDTIRIESALSEAGSRKLSWTHEMFDDVTDERVASCALTAVHIDASSRKAVEFPQGIQEIAARLLEQ
jgi:acyl-CoA thioesterase FadM